MKILIFFAAVFFCGLTLAQGLPRFGLARFGEASFGLVSPASTIPTMPFWAIALLAVMLCFLAYKIKF